MHLLHITPLHPACCSQVGQRRDFHQRGFLLGKATMHSRNLFFIHFPFARAVLLSSWVGTLPTGRGGRSLLPFYSPSCRKWFINFWYWSQHHPCTAPGMHCTAQWLGACLHPDNHVLIYPFSHFSFPPTPKC